MTPMDRMDGMGMPVCAGMPAFHRHSGGGAGALWGDAHRRLVRRRRILLRWRCLLGVRMGAVRWSGGWG